MKEVFHNYARLILITGVNLQKGEEVYISAEVNTAELVRAVMQEAYAMGAKHVTVLWGDEKCSRIKYLNETEQSITDIPDWRARQTEEIVDRKAVLVHIVSEDPNIFNGVSPLVLAASVKAFSEKCKKYRDSTMSGNTRWTLAPYPCEEWAKAVFPDISVTKAVRKLSLLIIRSLRLNEPDPIAAWQKHQKALSKRVDILNNAKIKKLVYKSESGTDLSIGLPDNYVFEGGAHMGGGGVFYTANLPTEEVFTAPHKDTAQGKLVASIPLIYQGNRIEGFWLKFKDGRVTEYHADNGEEFLKELIETDEGSHYLGEVALVGYNSPIQKFKKLFYNTLFDENASCHFALGRAYPTCIKGGENLSQEESLKAGLNYSIEHCDFMIGTPDLSITAKTSDGKEMIIFSNGDWAF